MTSAGGEGPRGHVAGDQEAGDGYTQQPFPNPDLEGHRSGMI